MDYNSLLSFLKERTQMGFRRNSFGEIVQISSTPEIAFPYDTDLFKNKLHNVKFPNLSITKANAEQEYIILNMVKGAIQETYEIAKKFNISIVTRPTSSFAFMNNETGYPTKPQEIKNKTCKYEDSILHPKITLNDLGAVVHYRPFNQNIKTYDEFKRYETNIWKKSYESIKSKILGNQKTDLNKLKNQFESRTKEYFEEDPHYRFGGKFSNIVTIIDPFLFLKSSPGLKIYGDHDLFCFADASGKKPSPFQNNYILLELRHCKRFQAQHGAIYYWNPTTHFDRKIKDKIMSNHDIYGDEPLIVSTPRCVQLSFFDTKKNCLISVWENLSNFKWLSTTHSGKNFLNSLPKNINSK
jgi:hypothetical protein